jgi:murein DD-endopeptidase MepM/ murein hydrolase activator NlpD
MLSRRDFQSGYLKNVLGAVVIGLLIGICVGLGIVGTLATRRVAALVIIPFPTSTETPTLLSTSISSSIPSSTLSPIATSTLPPRSTATSTPRPKPTPTPQPTRPSSISGQATPRPVIEHFLFGHPLALDAPAPAPNSVYLYGTTELGQYEVHHGVDFDRNSIGVPVFAIGKGTIVTAGDDREPLCGDKGQTVCGRFRNFYGLVVVIQLDQTYRGQTLFALYGHMDRIDVQVEQRVQRGDPIGAVGMTGIAIGPHIQFEIRIGANDYASTRNPMLWIAPLPGRGVLAGRYTDHQGVLGQDGNLMRGAIIDIYRAEEPDKFYRETETYSADEQLDVNSDDELGENFLMSDLPAGEYIVRVPGKPFAARVTAEAGKLTFVEIVN